MTPERLRQITDQLDRRDVARLLGYRSDNSLRQCERGKQSLPEEKAAWLETYAAMKAEQAHAEAAWLAENPPPDSK